MAESLIHFVSVLLVLGLVLPVHEFAHGWVAAKLGDLTAKRLGRLTLDPRAHLDPLGTLAIFLVGFGWGKPVPFNPANLKNPRRDSALVALAGPLANFLMALLLAGLLRVFDLSGWGLFLTVALVRFNLLLGLFNLLPVYPLDGFRVVLGFLPPSLAYDWEEMSRFGVFILMFLFLTGTANLILGVPLEFLLKLLFPS